MSDICDIVSKAMEHYKAASLGGMQTPLNSTRESTEQAPNELVCEKQKQGVKRTWQTIMEKNKADGLLSELH